LSVRLHLCYTVHFPAAALPLVTIPLTMTTATQEPRQVITKLLSGMKNVKQMMKIPSYNSLYPHNEVTRPYSHRSTIQDTPCSHTMYHTTTWPGGRSTSTTDISKQCFHLQKPSNTMIPEKHSVHQLASHPPLSSRPSFNTHKAPGRRNNSFCFRPLPVAPGSGAAETNRIRRKEQQFQEEGPCLQKKTLARRKTVANFQTMKPFYGRKHPETFEDHIYEEINDVIDQNDEEEHSFLSLISSERRRNLHYYGRTGWDFGPEM